jgi:hypothetical protein
VERPAGPPIGRPTTQPTRAVGRAAPKCQRRCWVPPREKIRGKLDRAEALPIFYPAIATKHDEPDDWTDQRPYSGHGKAEEPKAPTKGGHGHKITSRSKDGLDSDEIACVGAKKTALIRASAAATVRSKVGTRRGDGGAGMYLDNGVTAAARFAPGAMGRMPDNEAKAELECLMGAEVVRRVLAALRDNTNKEAERYDDNEEEPSGDGNNNGFVVTQDDDTEDNKTSGGEAPKVQQASGWKARQQTHKEAYLLADRGGGTLGLASDGKDRKTQNSKARPGRRAVNKDKNARALEARQGSRASDASKSPQKTEEAAHHPAYWGSGMHRRASEGEDEKDWTPKATQAEDIEAWVQAKEASYAQKKPNHAAHQDQGGGTRSPLVRTVLLGLAALFGPATSGKIRGKPERV